MPKILKKKSMNNLEVTTFACSGLEQHFITVRSSLDKLLSSMEMLTSAVSEENAELVSQVIFVPPGFSRDDVRSVETTFGEPKKPVAWIKYLDRDSERMFNVQAYVVSGSRVQPLEIDRRIVGSLFESGCARFFLLGNITPSDMSLSNPAQARQVLEKIDSALRSVDMTFRNVVRTWFYMDKVLSWYADFNKVRNTFFTEHGIYRGLIPASTAVGMSNPLGAAIVANVFAIQPKGESVRIQGVESPLQCSPLEYRNSFSRAVEVAMPDCRCLYVSGTASIGLDGANVHAGDVNKQIELTMKVIQGILISRGMGWADVNRAVAYFKNPEDIPRLLHYIQRQGLPALPLVTTTADICREDLLFELDADAVTGVSAEHR